MNVCAFWGSGLEPLDAGGKRPYFMRVDVSCNSLFSLYQGKGFLQLNGLTDTFPDGLSKAVWKPHPRSALTRLVAARSEAGGEVNGRANH